MGSRCNDIFVRNGVQRYMGCRISSVCLRNSTCKDEGRCSKSVAFRKLGELYGSKYG